MKKRIKNYIVEINNNAVIKDHNGIFDLNGTEMVAEYPDCLSTYIVPMFDKDVVLIKLGQYKKYIHRIWECQL